MNKKKQQPSLTTAIENYKNATYQLATVMSEVKTKQGRKTLEDVTLLDTSRINTFCRLGDIIKDVGNDLLPECLIELYGQPKNLQKQLAKKAKDENLKPSQLRKHIRLTQQTVKSNVKEKDIKVNTWQKNLLMLERDLKSMDNITRDRALAYVANNFSQFKIKV